MSPFPEICTRTKNFVIVGQKRSGTAILSGALGNVRGVVCHQHLLDADEDSRRKAHLAYYGEVESIRPTWLTPYDISVEHYLRDTVFDHPAFGEAAIGVRLTYDQLDALDLYDCLSESQYDVVHVVRNPLAALISLKQAERFGQWQQLRVAALPPVVPSAVRIEPEDAVQAVRNTEATQRRLESARRHRVLTIRYDDILQRYNHTLDDILRYLKIPANRPPAPLSARIRQRGDFARRVTNWAELTSVSALRPYLATLV